MSWKKSWLQSLLECSLYWMILIAVLEVLPTLCFCVLWTWDFSEHYGMNCLFPSNHISAYILVIIFSSLTLTSDPIEFLFSRFLSRFWPIIKIYSCFTGLCFIFPFCYMDRIVNLSFWVRPLTVFNLFFFYPGLHWIFFPIRPFKLCWYSKLFCSFVFTLSRTQV